MNVQELIDTARTLVADDKGLLAMDGAYVLADELEYAGDDLSGTLLRYKKRIKPNIEFERALPYAGSSIGDRHSFAHIRCYCKARLLNFNFTTSLKVNLAIHSANRWIASATSSAMVCFVINPLMLSIELDCVSEPTRAKAVPLACMPLMTSKIVASSATTI